MPVVIDPLSPEYYEQAAKWIGDPEINRWLYSEWREHQVSGKLVAVAAMNSRNRLFLIRYDGNPAGIAAVSQINNVDRHASVWYLLGDRTYGGKGIATTAVDQLVNYAFEMLMVHSLEASILETNVPSRRVLEKNGFQLTGRLREAFCIDDTFVDRLIFDRINSNLA